MAGLSFLAKFKKEVAKLDTVGVGIRTTEEWLSSGNYALNRALSGDWFRAIPMQKLSLFAGPSGSGKSFIAGNVCLEAQKEGYHVLYLDSEHAIDVDYLSKIGVNVSDEMLTYISVTTIEDVNSVLAEFFTNYQKDYGKDNDAAPKTLIVLDSLAMLSSATEMTNYAKEGIIKSDQGILAKRRKAMLRLAVGYIGRLPIAMLLTDHVYPQDVMLGDGPWTVTNSTKFSSSIIGLVTKLKLKEDTEVVGVRMRFETYKSRFAKLGTKIELEVPYNKGMSPFSGLCELLSEMGVIAKGTQPGEKLMYVCSLPDGTVIKFKESEIDQHKAAVERILREHPKCAPMMARNPVPDLIDDLDSVVDQDEVPQVETALVLKKGRKVKVTEE
jgi:recombination protein RecA